MTGKIAWFILLIAVVIGVYYYGLLTKTPEPPEIRDGWFGYGSKPKPDDMSIIKYKVVAPDEVLKDLKKRLDNSRLSEDLEEVNFEYGIQVHYKYILALFLNRARSTGTLLKGRLIVFLP